MPATERPDLSVLLQRLADALLKLVGERLELARVEARAEAKRLALPAAALIAGGLVATVGALLFALALVDALRPLLPSRALRLVTVGSPLLALGIVATRLALGRISPAPAPPTVVRRIDD
jgi:hypothetical protein